jgi:hypothetical protein
MNEKNVWFLDSSFIVHHFILQDWHRRPLQDISNNHPQLGRRT